MIFLLHLFADIMQLPSIVDIYLYVMSQQEFLYPACFAHYNLTTHYGIQNPNLSLSSCHLSLLTLLLSSIVTAYVYSSGWILFAYTWGRQPFESLKMWMLFREQYNFHWFHQNEMLIFRAYPAKYWDYMSLQIWCCLPSLGWQLAVLSTCISTCKILTTVGL